LHGLAGKGLSAAQYVDNSGLGDFFHRQKIDPQEIFIISVALRQVSELSGCSECGLTECCSALCGPINSDPLPSFIVSMIQHHVTEQSGLRRS